MVFSGILELPAFWQWGQADFVSYLQVKQLHLRELCGVGLANSSSWHSLVCPRPALAKQYSQLEPTQAKLQNRSINGWRNGTGKLSQLARKPLQLWMHSLLTTMKQLGESWLRWLFGKLGFSWAKIWALSNSHQLNPTQAKWVAIWNPTWTKLKNVLELGWVGSTVENPVVMIKVNHSGQTLLSNKQVSSDTYKYVDWARLRLFALYQYTILCHATKYHLYRTTPWYIQGTH